MQAVAPICEAVIRGYNGAVIAYGQTGAGKTHTMIGSKTGRNQGIAPRAVSAIFAALARRAAWHVEVSVLEVYNERVRDLLAPGGGVATVEIHEVRSDEQPGQSFRCPDATFWRAQTPDEALAALAEGARRRETARTDMNHHSSRSHLVFTICVWQNDKEAGATLRSRLHLVDLAGSERLKRSMAMDSPRHSGTGAVFSARQGPRVSSGNSMASSPSTARGPRDQRREAGEINRSLSQLALVIQRLTAPGPQQYVPYRDSMLTRLLAESFGGSSKTCLVIACSPLAENREETRSSLDFGRRAKLVRNKPRINLEVESEPSLVMRALVARELVQVQAERDALRSERDSLLEQVSQLQEEKSTLQQRLRRLSVPTATEAQEVAEKQELSARITSLLEEQAALQRSCQQAASESLRLQQDKAELLAKLEEQSLALHARWQEDVARLEQEKVATAKRLEEGKVALHQKLQEALSDAVQFQDERVAAALQLQEDKAMLNRRWQEEVQSAREEKALAIAALEEEKVKLHRQWQEELARSQECKAAAVSELEHEKGVLRCKWQDALEEVRRLQGQQAAMEAKIEEEKASLLAAAEADKIATQRQAQAKLSAVLEDKAAEASKLERERVALHRKLHEDVSRLDQERTALAARFEVEKVALRQKWQEATAEVATLYEERAMLVSKLEGDVALTQQRWQSDFSVQVQQLQRTRTMEMAHLESLYLGQLAAAERRCRESEACVARLEAELASLKPPLRLPHSQLAGHTEGGALSPWPLGAPGAGGLCSEEGPAEAQDAGRVASPPQDACVH